MQKNRSKNFRGLVFFMLIVPYSTFAAQSPYDIEESKIPHKPSSPPSLIQKEPPRIYHCERYYVYQGKPFECDSNLGNDAERLRPLMEDVPAAITELDAYQSNRQQVRMAAYFGTLGILAMITGLVIGRIGASKNSPAFDPVSGSPNLGGWVLIGGLGLTVNSLIFGISVGRTNEAHVGNAVQNFNQVHPDRPIELKFTTEVNF